MVKYQGLGGTFELPVNTYVCIGTCLHVTIFQKEKLKNSCIK